MVPTILVTGLSGFIGRAVALALSRRGLRVMGLDLHPKPVEGADFVKAGDIMDFPLVRGLVQDSDGVINLAGVLGTSELLDSIPKAIDLNIKAADNVFRACLDFDRPCVQITVGNHAWSSVYPVTKVCAEKLAQIYTRDLHASVAVVRAMNAYGPWQKCRPVRKLIPNLIRWAIRGEPVRLYGDGGQILDPIYVDDVAEILVRALVYIRGYVPTRVFEAGTGVGYSVEYVARLVWDMVNGSARPYEAVYEPMRPGEPENSVTLADPVAIVEQSGELGAMAFTPLVAGLERTIRWYREHPEFTA